MIGGASTGLYLPGTTPAESGTEPTVSVAGRLDTYSYTVTGGAARSLSITAEAGATLLTTVRTSVAGVVVTGATTTTPSWTAPATGAVQVDVTATKDGLSRSVSFTEDSGAAAGFAWAGETVSMAGASSTGDAPPWSDGDTAEIDDGSNTIDIEVTENAGAGNHSVDLTANGAEIVSGTGSVSLAFDIADKIAGYGLDTYRPGGVMVHVVLDDIDIASSGQGILIAVSDVVTGLGVYSRGIRYDWSSSGNVQPKWWVGGSSNKGSPISTPTQLTLSFVVYTADETHVYDQPGVASIPSPSTVLANTETIYDHADTQGDEVRPYESALYLDVVGINGGDCTVVDVRWEVAS